MKKEERKNVSKKIIKKAKGITLISLVITIIILLILAGVTLSLTLGDNGIITQAQKAKEAQEIAAIKEDLQLAILDKELEKGGTGLTQEELEEIAGNYGELQEDGNTIKTEDGYEIKIDEIYKPGGGTSGGGSGASDEELAALEEKIKELEQTVEDLNNTKTELEGTIEDLNGQLEQAGEDKAALQEQIENLQGQVDSLTKTKEELEGTISDLNTQIAELQKKQATGTAVASDVLENKTFSNSSNVGIKGTMSNRGTLNWSSSNTTYNVPAGYYSGGTLDSRPSYNAGYSAGNSAGYNSGYSAGNSAGYNNGYNAGVNAGKVSNWSSKTLTVTSSGSDIAVTRYNAKQDSTKDTTCPYIQFNTGVSKVMAIRATTTAGNSVVISWNAGYPGRTVNISGNNSATGGMELGPIGTNSGNFWVNSTNARLPIHGVDQTKYRNKSFSVTIYYM